MKTLAAVLVALTLAAPAAAQGLAIRGFGDVGNTTFTASQSFTALFGSRNGLGFGGGVEAVTHNIFFGVRGSRMKKSGTRVFVSNGERFDLGIKDEVTISPLDVSVGYQFARPPAPPRRGAAPRLQTVIPYVGGGLGWYRYQETSDFSASGEDADETFRGYHLLGGAEVRLTRYIGFGAELQWATVPNALGQNTSSVAKAYNETDLGGFTVRGKVLVGSW